MAPYLYFYSVKLSAPYLHFYSVKRELKVSLYNFLIRADIFMIPSDGLMDCWCCCCLFVVVDVVVGGVVVLQAQGRGEQYKFQSKKIWRPPKK